VRAADASSIGADDATGADDGRAHSQLRVLSTRRAGAQTAEELLRLIDSGHVRRAAGLSGLVDRASDRVPRPGVDRVVDVVAPLRELLPGRGLRRGSTVTVVGATSLLIALLAGASRAGSWCAVVGLPTMGVVAAAELGCDLDRIAFVPDPGPDWPEVVAALLDGCDLVVAYPPSAVAPAVVRRLSARARQRGSVLVPVGGSWLGAELTLEVAGGTWYGLGRGRGRLRCRKLTVVVRGRGAAGRARQVQMWLPELTGPLPTIAGTVVEDADYPAAGEAGETAVGA
jgi:hypothetical protein